jgi:hypothetical protein
VRKETPVNLDDLLLVSIDDHVEEPPDMFARRVATKHADEVPRVVAEEQGVDRWMCRDRPTGVVGLMGGALRRDARRLTPTAPRRSAPAAQRVTAAAVPSVLMSDSSALVLASLTCST